MITVISPSKKQDFTPVEFKQCQQHSTPQQLAASQQLINILLPLSKTDIGQLMAISDNLSALNHQRYREFKLPLTLKNAKQAVLAFKGDVYSGIDVEQYSQADFEFAQANLRILSGLYGVLKPLDLIAPYRLEMGTKLANAKGKNLYEFWGETLSQAINQQEQEILVNLASNEYFKGIDRRALNAKVLQIDFKENKNGQYKIIGIHAKKARGLMVNYIIKNQITHPEKLKKFNANTYQFNAEFSSEWHWVFTR